METVPRRSLRPRKTVPTYNETETHSDETEQSEKHKRNRKKRSVKRVVAKDMENTKETRGRKKKTVPTKNYSHEREPEGHYEDTESWAEDKYEDTESGELRKTVPTFNDTVTHSDETEQSEKHKRKQKKLWVKHAVAEAKENTKERRGRKKKTVPTKNYSHEREVHHFILFQGFKLRLRSRMRSRILRSLRSRILRSIRSSLRPLRCGIILVSSRRSKVLRSWLLTMNAEGYSQVASNWLCRSR